MGDVRVLLIAAILAGCSSSPPPSDEPIVIGGAGGAPAPTEPDAAPAAAPRPYAPRNVRAAVVVDLAALQLEPMTIDYLFEADQPPPSPAMRRARLEQAPMLRKLLDATAASDPTRPELSFRLGEILAVEAFQLLRDGDARRGQPLAREAAQALVPVLSATRFARRDEALILMARLALSGGQADVARQTILLLLKDLPMSRYVPHGYLIFADWYAGERKPADAERFYDKVLQFPASPRTMAYALAQKGRLRLAAGDAAGALAAFDKALQANAAARLNVVDRVAGGGQAAVRYYLAEHAWARAAAATDAATALPLWKRAAAELQAAADHPYGQLEHRTEAAEAAALAADNAAAIDSGGSR